MNRSAPARNGEDIRRLNTMREAIDADVDALQEVNGPVVARLIFPGHSIRSVHIIPLAAAFQMHVEHGQPPLSQRRLTATPRRIPSQSIFSCSMKLLIPLSPLAP